MEVVLWIIGIIILIIIATFLLQIAAYAVGVGLLVGFFTWIIFGSFSTGFAIGAIGCFVLMVIGMIMNGVESVTKKCGNCHSGNVDIKTITLEKGEKLKLYVCRKCYSGKICPSCDNEYPRLGTNASDPTDMWSVCKECGRAEQM